MIPEIQQKAPLITSSKIRHLSFRLHPLARFVTEETVALMFNLKPEDIYRIECWQHIVYVYGKGVSRFVSYADFPPIKGVTPPTQIEMQRWRKRWYKSHKSHTAPSFWTEFYTLQFQQASSVAKLLEWGQVVASITFGLSSLALQQLREVYRNQKEGFNF